MTRNLYLIFGSMLILALLAYWPGLTGTFMLDDYGSLPSIAQWGEINSFHKLYEFVFSGFTGPTGRPVALLTFVLNSTRWPADPFAFLLTNVFIHLLNSLLLAVTLKQILTAAKVSDSGKLACFAAAIWALHPSQVSTVLYVVQRMTQLEVTFNLLAIMSYLVLRQALLDGRLTKALGLIALLGITGILAVFSKENAVLIPLQLALIESLIGSKNNLPSNRYYVVAKWAIIVIPSAVVIAYLLKKGWQYFYLSSGSEVREFTAWERQLTEFRVVGDYLWMFLLPKINSPGVFHDGYSISRSLFAPVSTLYWLLTHTTILTISVLYRRRWPVLAFSVLWFYCNHLVESTVIQLELKFEHRNYLPSVGLALALAFGLNQLPISRNIRNMIFGAVTLFLAIGLYARASLWGNPLVAAGVWVEENPRSYRALEHAAMIYGRAEHGETKAQEFLRRAVTLSGHDPVVELKYLSYRCQHNRLTEDVLQSLEQRFPDSPMNWQVSELFDGLLDKMIAGKCPAFSAHEFDRLIAAALKNNKYSKTGIHLQLRHVRAKAELILGNKDKGMKMFLENFNSETVPLGIIMQQSVLLASQNKLQAAFLHIDRAIQREKDKGGNTTFLLRQAEEIRDNIRRDM